MASFGQSCLTTTSASRSVPLACSVAVMQTSAPNAVAARSMRSSSVAITTWPAALAEAVSNTYCSIGLPSNWRSGFPGRRVEAKRAGMTTL
jgi:hypothetical protein